MKIHQGLSESRIKSSGRPPGFGYLGQQCDFSEKDLTSLDLSILTSTRIIGQFAPDLDGRHRQFPALSELHFASASDAPLRLPAGVYVEVVRARVLRSPPDSVVEVE